MPNVSPLGLHQANNIKGEGRRRKLPAYKRLRGEECVKMCERWLGEVRKGWKAGWDAGVNNVSVSKFEVAIAECMCERKRER